MARRSERVSEQGCTRSPGTNVPSFTQFSIRSTVYVDVSVHDAHTCFNDLTGLMNARRSSFSPKRECEFVPRPAR